MPSLLLGPVLRHVSGDSATIWVETDGPCEVDVLGCTERTFAVAGHHYALVRVTGLEPGTATPYTVRLDGAPVWPDPGADLPPSRIRALATDGRPLRVTFGSCRYSTGRAIGSQPRYGVDVLDAFARRMAVTPEDGWPDLVLMLGDQVYADETSPRTRERIAARRDPEVAPGEQVADFEEYTWLYHESWGDPEVRWLMSTVPIAMIFDDHDVHDDWNTSRAWRRRIQATPWWDERITGGLMSYWVYQHLGNLSPDELDRDAMYATVRAAAAAGEDAAPALREFARAADREADGAKGYRWSFWRDLGRTRLVVVDSRCGRILDGDGRSMLSEEEFAWVEERLTGDYDHLLVGTSVPWLLSPALHSVEAWNERLCERRSPLLRRAGEAMRQAVDLEHWPAFNEGFDRMAGLLAEIGRGRGDGPPPATISVLSGDVHHSYVCEADYPDGVRSRVFQLTCSPMHNWVPAPMRLGFRAAWSRAGERFVRYTLGRLAPVPLHPLTWTRIGRVVFGNAIASILIEGRSARVVLETSSQATPDRPLSVALAADLAQDPATVSAGP